MNVIRISTIALLASMALAGCGRGANVTEEDWKLAFDKGVDIRHGNTWVVRGMTAEYKLGDRLVNTQAYGKHSFKEERIKDGFGKGKKWTITYTDPALPVLTQTFYLYDDYLLTDISVASDSGVSTNYMAPVVMERTDSLICGEGRRMLFIPFDNDAWIRFASRPLSADTMRSYEVTSIYDAGSRRGIVIGAIDHDRWKMQ